MIECKNITKIFNQNRHNEQIALKNINLKIKKNELTVLKGASGSGKSTLLSLIAALSRPTKGEIIVDGKRVSKMLENSTAMFRRENIGFIFQKYNLISTLNSYENIILPTIPSNPNEKELTRHVDTLLEMFSITNKKQNSAAADLNICERHRTLKDNSWMCILHQYHKASRLKACTAIGIMW
ncbi:MAG: ABC transporter ATP-binding protein [Sulfurospirillum sp.]|nr:ABC transporter ATP-binding protein [Sulfurospirillum sp.]